MPVFSFKEMDAEGLKTLETLSVARRLNRWMYDMVVENLVQGSVLEIGSGIGNISQHFLENGWKTALSDLRPAYVAQLTNTFGSHPDLIAARILDLVHPRFEQEYAEWLGRFDNLFALNVVEHIEIDTLALQNALRLLRPGGRLLILVPAWQWLYNDWDRQLGHFRRYTRKTLSAVTKAAGFQVRRTFYFNLAGMAGWLISGSILRRPDIPSGQVKLFNMLTPVFRLVDKLVGNRVGLSVVVVAER